MLSHCFPMQIVNLGSVAVGSRSGIMLKSGYEFFREKQPTWFFDLWHARLKHTALDNGRLMAGFQFGETPIPASKKARKNTESNGDCPPSCVFGSPALW